VLIAFRCALRSFIHRNDLESSGPGDKHSWAAVVGIQDYEALEMINRFCSEKVSKLSPTQINNIEQKMLIDN
jgi:hypothetical protein